MGLRIKNVGKRAGILLGIFVAALIISSLVTNRGTDDRTVGISDPTLPRISFMVADRSVNALAGYTNEMDITAMRNTITPIPDNGMVLMNLQSNGNDITNIRYEVRSLDGGTVYQQETVKDIAGTNVTLDLNAGLPEGVSESVLCVEMSINSEKRCIFIQGLNTSRGFGLKNVWILQNISMIRQLKRMENLLVNIWSRMTTATIRHYRQ